VRPDPAVIEQIKARRTPEQQADHDQEAAIKKLFQQITIKEFGQHARNACNSITDAARAFQPPHEMFSGHRLIRHGLDLFIAAVWYQATGRRGDIPALYAQQAQIAEDAWLHCVRDGVEAYGAHVHDEHVAYKAQLDAEHAELRDMTLAQVERVTEENRQLERERDAAKAEAAKARAAARRERDEHAREVRSLREERRQLLADLEAARALIASLNAELEQLTAPKEATPMSDTNLEPKSALERMSWFVWSHDRYYHRGTVTLAAWRAAVRDTQHHAFVRQHLEARGLVGRAA